MSYHATLERLTDDVQAKVLSALQAWQEGRVTRDQFVQVVAAHVAMGNARAVALADLALASTLSVELGVAQPAVGIVAKPDEGERLSTGVATLAVAAAAGTDITARLIRFATAEPSGAAADAWSEGISKSKKVHGWSRQLDADPCELCQSWAKGNRVFPKNVQMLHHTGCQCTPKPVVKREGN